MSTLVVEVCMVNTVEPHPRADRLAIATVKGWKVCIRYDPELGSAEFNPGDKCVYFPPDSILPPKLANDRLNIMKYLAELPKDESGNRPSGGRVRAARLRGEQSFGVIMPIDPEQGDDPDWPVGTDVREHFGVQKWEPPPRTTDGDAAPAHPRFHRYTDIEHWNNFPDVIADGEEVVVTEKLHGKNCRVGLVLETNDDGQPTWTWMAGSHDVRRHQFSTRQKRFDAEKLVEMMLLETPIVEIGQIIDLKNGEFWCVDEVRDQPGDDDRALFKATQVTKTGEEIQTCSEFWEPLNEELRSLLEFVRDDFLWNEPKHGIVLFGEIIGRGVQKGMEYGCEGRSFRAFDLAVNGRYVGYEEKTELFDRFRVAAVPVLYRGAFSRNVIDQFTDGATTLANADQLGRFKGREGIVITPVRERPDDETMLLTGTRGRVIFKSVSADYLAAKGISDSH